MNGSRRILLLVILFLLAQYPWSQTSHQQPRYKNEYEQAERLYYADQSDDVKDSVALALYLNVIASHKNADSIYWDSHYKAGIYLQTAGKYREAIPYFQKAVTLQPQDVKVREQHFYLPNLYLGHSYYSLSMLDSAVYYYKRAEQIAIKYPETEGIERLYNTLGAINYESGDYQQSRIYFEKALDILQKRQPSNTTLLVNFKNNLASSYRQLKEYDKALEIFNGLLKYNVNRDEIMHNLAAIYLELKKDSHAIAYLKKVSYNNQNKYNDLGVAFSREDEPDTALFYFRKALEVNREMNGTRKNIQQAITCQHLGDYFVNVKNYDSALIEYQLAIVQLVYDFNDDDVRANPVAFEGYFAVSELFNALSAKAATFTLRYQLDHNKNDLLYSLFAYDALYKLADYVIRTYNSDEARLLLTNRKHLSHTEPIDNALKLFEITGDSIYLRHAFRFDEKNKATLLALQLQESGSKRTAGLPAELLQKEKILSREITGLQLQDVQLTDSVAKEKHAGELRDKQIELSDLHKKFDEYPSYKRLRFIDNSLNAQQAMKLVPQDYAVVTYHMGDTNLVGFVITNKSFSHFVVEDTGIAKKSIDLYKFIQLTDQNVSKDIDSLSRSLYSQLIAPIGDRISGFRNLIIIPDDELSYLPFEILKSDKNELLVNRFSIAYNYSVSLLNNIRKEDFNSSSTIAFAPFTKSLRASRKEIENIKGDKLFDTAATKTNFVNKAADYSIVHLATHAAANDSVPARSYISFYSKDSASSMARLYTPEISNLAMNNVKLVILSACETGAGQLIKGEGLMSLTRSFSNAGCQNTIASLWKADDVSTSQISRHLHQHLKNGSHPAEALSKAKQDYLNDGDVPARLKAPAYWAHLKLVGGFTETKNTGIWWKITLAAAILIAAYLFLKMAIFKRNRNQSLT